MIFHSLHFVSVVVSHRSFQSAECITVNIVESLQIHLQTFLTSTCQL